MTATLKVFIADDSARFKSVLANSITDLTGADVVGTAETFDEAIHSIRTLQPDVVIANIHLKTGTAVDVMQGIRKGRNTSPVVIMMTNYLYNAEQKIRLSHGAEYLFHKASEFDSIISVIKDLKLSGWSGSNEEMMAASGNTLYH